MTRVALVGSTGGLGRLVGSALLDLPDVQLRLLVRPGSEDRARALQARGAELVTGDVAAGGEAALSILCEGVDAVVSTLQGGPDVIVDGQRRLLRAARDAAVRRFVPSDYSLNLFGLRDGENTSIDWRRAFARLADAERGDVAVTHVLIGCFLDRNVLFGFLGAVDLDRDEAHLWGQGDQPMQFTTYDDTARYVAAAVTAADPLPGRLELAGDTLDFHDLVKAVEQGSGRTLTVRRHGSLADLDTAVTAARRRDPDDPAAFLPLMYWRAMLSGRGNLGPLDNQRFPDIIPTTVSRYVEREGL